MVSAIVLVVVARTHTASVGGIQISASHNPADYNGLKFWWDIGEKYLNEAKELYGY